VNRGAAPADELGVSSDLASRGWRGVRRPWFLPQGRRLSPEVWAQRHRGLTIWLWLNFPALYIFAVVRGYGTASALLAACVLIPTAMVASSARLSRNLRSASTSLGLVLGASLFVHLAGGATEAHFIFFVILASLTLYQAWLPLLVALAYVVIEHGVIGALDPRGVYADSTAIAHPWRYALIHGGFVLAASFANILSWRLTEHEAWHDGLTGLANRTYFLQTLDLSLASRGRGLAAVIFIDLDNFKDANDAFGHDVGDLLLQSLSKRLRGTLRAEDLLARLGGDEFAIALRDLESRDEARAAAQRILVAIGMPVVINGVTLTPETSLGLAFATVDDSAAGLLRNADLAMYEAKRKGGGRVEEFAPVLYAVALRRTELEAELRVALAEQQFVVHYQSIVDLTTNELVGTEALVRWQHPTRGLLFPAEFIGAAEQSGLVVPLGVWVLKTACRQTAAWHALRPDHAPLYVSVNLAPRQLLDRTLVATVAESLCDAGLDASALCLEITEGSVIKDFGAALPVLNALRKLGVSLALDDFGTGYSSLSYLKQLPVNSVKIDRSFIADLTSDTGDSEIVRAIVGLAHTMGLSVTAEGVETVEQLELLRAMKSDHAQGYVLGRPSPAETLNASMAAVRPAGWSAAAAS
jgi:diguanylate cyclase (GGDEF)-like protein